MRFRISHETLYRYGSPASESVGELRVCPRDDASQVVANRTLALDPAVPVDAFTDYFGNTVECFSIPFRHRRLRVRMTADIVTRPAADPGAAADLPVAAARRLDPRLCVDLYPFRQATRAVPLGRVLHGLNAPVPQERVPLREALPQLNGWIYAHFSYQPGVTDVSTPLATVIRKRRGVCQDFAHLMLAILRSAGLAARYVSGYIEPVDPTLQDGAELIGAAASHAWVEVRLPDGAWWGFDPTNNQCAGERHVKVAVGRDYHDVAPMRGTYKGAVNQKLHVIVSMKRRAPKRRPA
jgi:transglutaminase-like putative cysteine protease